MHDAQPAYASIVGAGANACVLHYRDNAARSRDGDLVLVDAGAEYRGYAADITRTFPLSGRFTREQRALHDLVLAAQAAALAQARPGVPYEAGHEAAVETLTEGLLSLGLLKGRLEAAIAAGDYKRFYRHKTGHWLGLDVHDVGEYRIDGESRLLEPGMVFTIEPGLYIPEDNVGVPAKWRGIGIRIEDDVLVTPQGHRVLTDALELIEGHPRDAAPGGRGDAGDEERPEAQRDENVGERRGDEARPRRRPRQVLLRQRHRLPRGERGRPARFLALRIVFHLPS